MTTREHSAVIDRVTWSAVVESLSRPYRVTLPMVVLVALVPLYVFIPVLTPDRTLHAPELALDRLVPLQPVWALVYGPLYLFLILVPALVFRQPELIDRTVRAYLSVWLVSYAVFLVYPTVLPRPDEVAGEGFAVWGLRFLYDADAPYNCFPSLHVAHSFVSALACSRMHRGLGVASAIVAALVAVSTVFIKQHYVVDVIAGVLLAGAAYLVFLRGYPRDRVAEIDRRLAPALALVTAGLVGLVFVAAWMAFWIQ